MEILGQSPLVNRKRTGTVSKLPPRTVELIRPVGTQELLELLPGINGYADDGFGNSRLSIGIRGLNPRRSSRVLILEDGVPIQPAVYVYPNAYYNPPSERIDAMEVVKGSSAVRFGPQTMGGGDQLHHTQTPTAPGGWSTRSPREATATTASTPSGAASAAAGPPPTRSCSTSTETASATTTPSTSSTAR